MSGNMLYTPHFSNESRMVLLPNLVGFRAQVVYRVFSKAKVGLGEIDVACQTHSLSARSWHLRMVVRELDSQNVV